MESKPQASHNPTHAPHSSLLKASLSSKSQAQVCEISKYDQLECNRMDAAALHGSLSQLYSLINESSPGELREEVTILNQLNRIVMTTL